MYLLLLFRGVLVEIINTYMLFMLGKLKRCKRKKRDTN